MDRMSKLMAGLLILTFFVGVGVGYLIPIQSEPYEAGIAGKCPTEITSLEALTIALHDPEVVGLLDNKSIDTIAFSKGSYSERGVKFTQIVFHPRDPNPDDRMTTSMIVVQINKSCMVSAAYETYPSYIPEIATETREAS